MKRSDRFLFFVPVVYILFSVLLNSCAQIGMPTGGAKDSIPPVLIKASPALNALNFNTDRIVFTFDEYVNLQDAQSNVMVSPFQKSQPSINYNFKTVTVRLRDSLLPNTTYSIDFGDAIKDLNENNPLKNFIYTFSTGSFIDSMSLSGTVTLAETGGFDSTMIVALYSDLTDSAVRTKRPLYISRIRGDGSFTFRNLPPATFNVFAFKDGDNSKTYNSKSETFAFLDSAIKVSGDVRNINLFAYAEEKPKDPVTKTQPEKVLRYATNLEDGKLNILRPLTITFNNPVKTFDTSSILLADTLNSAVTAASYFFDSTRRVYNISNAWKPGVAYRLLINSGITDSANNALKKADTINFVAKSTSEYGRVVLRFSNLRSDQNSVIQLLKNNEVIISSALSSPEWRNNLVPPGEYDVRIVYDSNGNGIWDPGNYSLKRQPEKSITLSQKLAIRADWDNERNITL